MQDDVNLSILRMLYDNFSLDAAHLSFSDRMFFH